MDNGSYSTKRLKNIEYMLTFIAYLLLAIFTVIIRAGILQYGAWRILGFSN